MDTRAFTDTEHRKAAFETTQHLHELLGLALDDLGMAMADPRYMVDMAQWHRPSGDVCRVCLGGSVIANRYADGPADRYDAEDFSLDVTNRLYALNALRGGDIAEAHDYLHGQVGGKQPDSVRAMGARWEDKMQRVAHAVGATEARTLLAELRALQADLKEEGL